MSIDKNRQREILDLSKFPTDLASYVKNKNDDVCIKALICLVDYSQFANRVIRKYPEKIISIIRSDRLSQRLTSDYLLNTYKQKISAITDVNSLDVILRQIRNIEMLLIAWREFSGKTNTEHTMSQMTILAEFSLNVAYEFHLEQFVNKYGRPFDEKTNESEFVIFALGKLGGRELNFSSDIDLIFAYSSSGDTNGNNSVSNNEFFLKLGRAIISSLNNITGEGFVFRVDMRLRPNGQSGPLVMSFSAMENYYQIHGREWERYAWIKARAIACNTDTGNEFLNNLKPFIYRKYLDYQVYYSIKNMKEMINKEIQQQGMQQNIKLGQGGIREVEFIVQSHQLVRGGRLASLRARSLKEVLVALAETRLLDEALTTDLYQAYLFLRTVEHRLQIYNDEQIHDLPLEEDKLSTLSATMDLTLAEFNHLLKTHRDNIHYVFSSVHRKDSNDVKDNWAIIWNNIVHDKTENTYQFTDGKAVDSGLINSIKSFSNSKSYRSLTTAGRRTIDHLLPKLLELINTQKNSQITLIRVLNVIEKVGRRTSYLSLLNQFPNASKQLVQLCSSSAWISQLIAQHPIVMDTLINPRADLYNFNNPNLESIVEKQLKEIPDIELKHDILRQIHHTCLLQIAIAHLNSQFSELTIRKYITLIAEIIVKQTLKLCQLELSEKFGTPISTNNLDGFAIIAYGKLGSQELSYNADLDLVFVYDDEKLKPTTQSGEKSVRIDYYFSRLVQRIITMLSMQTSAGKLYEVDTRLRPSGKSGLLVSSMTQYCKYQLEQAWLWEHQALVKARMISDSLSLQEKFEKLRTNILTRNRPIVELSRDIHGMRKRMRQATKQVDINYKASQGGLIDIEFIAQFIVLAYAFEHNQLLKNRRVIDIFKTAVKLKLITNSTGDTIINSYKSLLEYESQNRLFSNTTINDELLALMQNSCKIYNQILTCGK